VQIERKPKFLFGTFISFVELLKIVRSIFAVQLIKSMEWIKLSMSLMCSSTIVENDWRECKCILKTDRFQHLFELDMLMVLQHNYS
jgi:hypothetical protein